jgi:[protein-PII] uridylyltransferase
VNAPTPVVKARVIGQNQGLQIMVYAKDRPDLFVAICAYFDQHTLSIQDARIHTTRHGWALDSFIVLLPEHDTDYRSWASLVEHELIDALQQAVPGGAAQTQRIGRMSRRSRVFPVVPNVELQPDENSKSWRLAVTASDRPGLLYSLAQVFAHHNINLQMAKVLTLGDRVEDVFIIQGDALEHPRAQLQFERNLLSRLSNSPSPAIAQSL